MDGIRCSNKEIHSPFLCVNVRISWGEKLGSTENNEINKTQTLIEREITLHRLQAAHTLNQIN